MLLANITTNILTLSLLSLFYTALKVLHNKPHQQHYRHDHKASIQIDDDSKKRNKEGETQNPRSDFNREYSPVTNYYVDLDHYHLYQKEVDEKMNIVMIKQK